MWIPSIVEIIHFASPTPPDESVVLENEHHRPNHERVGLPHRDGNGQSQSLFWLLHPGHTLEFDRNITSV